LTAPSRFLKIALDSGPEILLPHETVDAQTTNRIALTNDGTMLTLPADTGVLELWDKGQIIQRAAFEPPCDTEGI
jgi:hypothetical protein